jgi:hypothetical protein
MARHDSNAIIKFAEDTTVVGLITDNDETACREVRDLAMWCRDNYLSLNGIKTKEMIVDYRKRRTEQEQVESFKFLAVHITNKLTWSKHTKSREEGITKPIPLQETEKIWHWSSDPQKILQLHHREHPDWLHHCLIWQLLGLQPQGTTEGIAYGPVHHWGQASCHPGPLYQAVSEENCHTPTTVAIDCSLCYSMASGTGARSPGPRGF